MTNKERLANALEAHQALINKQEELRGDGNVTVEVRSEIESLDLEIDAKAVEIERLEERVNQETKVAETRARYSSILDVAPKSEREESAQFNEELRSALLGQVGNGIDIDAGRFVTDMAQYRAAPVKAAGGNYTNDDFVTAVMTAFAENTTVFRAGARVVQTSSGEPIDAPVLANIGAALVAEGAAIPETTDNTKKTLSSYKYPAIALISKELVQDASVDIAALVAGMLADNVAGAVNTDFMVGNGSNKPSGLVTGAGVGATAAGASVVTDDDLYALYYSVKDSARNKGAWFMDPATAAALRGLSNVWTINPASDNPEQLLGRPVYTDATMDVAATTKRSIVFGDPKAYFVRSVRGLRVERSDDYKFGNDVVAVKAVWRGDGVVTDPNALKALVHP